MSKIPTPVLTCVNAENARLATDVGITDVGKLDATLLKKENNIVNPSSIVGVAGTSTHGREPRFSRAEAEGAIRMDGFSENFVSEEFEAMASATINRNLLESEAGTRGGLRG